MFRCFAESVDAKIYAYKNRLLATAGVNHHVLLWNPYVISKPVGVLRGHMQSVVVVKFIESRGQTISLSKDKVTVCRPCLVLADFASNFSPFGNVINLNKMTCFLFP